MPQNRKRRTKNQRAEAARRQAKIRQLRTEQMTQMERRSDLKNGGVPMWGKMLISVAVVLLLLIVFFRVDEFEVSGNVRYTAEEVAGASGVTVGDVLMGVNKTQTAGRILAGLPYVETVTVSKRLPGTIRFEITESVAAAKASSHTGSIWLMTREGELLERLDEDTDSGYPEITGTVLDLPISGDKAVFEDAVKGERALTLLSAICDANLQSFISQIDVEDPQEVTLFYLDRLEVQLGDGSDAAYKLQYMVEAAAKLSDTDKGVLDLSFENGTQAVFHPIR